MPTFSISVKGDVHVDAEDAESALAKFSSRILEFRSPHDGTILDVTDWEKIFPNSESVQEMADFLVGVSDDLRVP